jgi:hypothetical protein
MEDELYIVKEKSVLYSVAQSQLTHLRMHFWPVMRGQGPQPASQRRDNIVPSQNFLSENGSVDYLVCS